MMRNSSLRIVVTGVMGSIPMPGLVTHYIQYVLGLTRLGHDVLYLEDTGWYFDPVTLGYRDAWTHDDIPIGNRPAATLHRIFADHGLPDGWTYVEVDGMPHGVEGGQLREFLRTADLFLHVSGAGILRESYLEIPRRAYIDTDPAYVQVRSAAGSDKDDAHLGAHTSHHTYGLNVGADDCLVPTLGYDWHRTRQPIVLDRWPQEPPAPATAPYTTVLTWKPYDAIEHDGRRYGMKDIEFLRFVDLPRRVDATLELAMHGQPPIPAVELAERGWQTCEALTELLTVADYRAHIVRSRAEWTVAKQGYVVSRSGWMGDRGPAYLATGRPVVMQSTGFESSLPTGEGLLTFSDLDGAVAAIEDVEARYTEHCRAARALAEAEFEAGHVLRELVEVTMASPAGRHAGGSSLRTTRAGLPTTTE